MLTDERLCDVAERLVCVGGVVGVMLGGSRARGDEHLDSDVDLGLYYRPPLDLAGLQTLAEQVVGSSPSGQPHITVPGAWGPWVDGGGWLTIDATPVDWLYRDLDRVATSVRMAEAGEFDFHFQIGHPLGVPDFGYAAELALGVPLADPDGELARLKAHVATYPPQLAAAVIGRLGEAEFVLSTLRKPAIRGDAAYLAGALFRVVGLCGHALHAISGRWVTNEKGLVEAAGKLDVAPADFTSRAQSIFAQLGTTPVSLNTSVDLATDLLAEVVAAGSRLS